MKVLKELEMNFSLSIHRVVEVREDNVDIARGSPSLVSLLIDWLRARISRLFRVKFRDVFCRIALIFFYATISKYFFMGSVMLLKNLEKDIL